MEERYGTCLKRAYILRLPALCRRNLELFFITTIAAACFGKLKYMQLSYGQIRKMIRSGSAVLRAQELQEPIVKCRLQLSKTLPLEAIVE